MALSKQPYRGTRDFFPADMRLRNFIFQKMSEVSESFAYEPYDGPLLEEVELYLAKSGEELINEQIYSFTDRGDRKVAIRPEMTPTVARMVAQIHREVAKPLRWYAIPNLMRYEKMQKGRLREFFQYNADIFGAGAKGDLEIIQLAIALMQSFGATSSQFEILLNDRRIVDFVFNKLLKLDSESNKKLYKLVDRKNKMEAGKFSAEVRNIISEESAAKIFEQYVELKSAEDISSFMQQSSGLEEASPLITLLNELKNLGLGEFVKFDPSIVRGLDYYTGMVFEIFDKHPDNNRAVAGGGSYANLLQIFNEPSLEGVGIGLGEVPLKNFLESHGLLPDVQKATLDVLLATSFADGESQMLKLAQNLRTQGLKVEVMFGETKHKKIFTHAERKIYKAVLIFNEAEAKENKVQVKNLTNKTGEFYSTVEINQIVKAIEGK